MILKNLNQLALDAQTEFNSYHKQEIILSSEFKKEFAEVLGSNSSEDIQYSPYTSVIKTSSALTITFPNQWFFIASYFTEYLIALKEYKRAYGVIFHGVADVKDIIKTIKESSDISEDIEDRIDNHFSDAADREFFKKFLSDYSWWYGNKTIDRGDYYVSPILNLAKVVNVSQAYIADLANILSENPPLVNSLRKSTISENLIQEENLEELVIEENSSIRDFALNVFNHFYKNQWPEFLESTKSKAAKINAINFTSHDIKPFVRLVAEFPTAQTKDTLSSSGILRFFENPVYQNEDRFFYFSTQWFGTGDESLSFQNLKSHFETLYPQYIFEKAETSFKLIKKGLMAIPFDCKAFHQKTKEAGLKFSEKIVSRFIASLCTKPFVICTGLSGSGKTKLAQSFVQWICESNDQYKIVPVGADWTNREPLLGFPNGLDLISYIYPDSGVLQLILNAVDQKNVDKPYFLILDEMNLSHVERYFADFLSIMESQDNIKLYSGGTRSELPKEIFWPRNLFIIGTVNIDETTYMFSPKVLDRANVIEFRITENEIDEYLTKPAPVEMSKFINQQNNQGHGAPMAVNYLNITRANAISEIPTKENLLLFFKELKKSGNEFGYRSASEINRLIAILDTITKDNKKWDGFDIDTDEFIDIAVMQKLLPKLHGSRNKLTKVLPVLGGLCLNDDKGIKESYFEKLDSIDFAGDKNIKYKISFEKICRMYRNAIENGFASYAEA